MADPNNSSSSKGISKTLLLGVMIASALGTAVVAYVLVVMFGRKAEQQNPFYKVAEVSEISTNSAPWGLNFPNHYDEYLANAGDKFYGGSSALPESKLDIYPWLKRFYAGYAFSIDFRKARGHAYMLYDQGVTERITKKPQAGACIHCHASATVMWRKKGLEAMGLPADDATLAADFIMPAVIKGFQEVSRLPYSEVLAMVEAAPDGTPDDMPGPFPQAPTGGFTGEFAGEKLPDGAHPQGKAHPVGCIDCHNPKNMDIRVTRPGFMQGIADLAAPDAPVPHLPSIEKWRRGDRSTPYDPNRDGSRQEMRSFVCGQCHVEYYCANKEVLTFPWGNGLRAEDEETFWNDMTFSDGEQFYDWKHAETGAKLLKVQHPEFEMWSQGIHARSGVACVDCHMPYERKGAMKLTNHTVQSPLARVNNACQTCHNVSEADLVARVVNIQDKNRQLLGRAADAMIDMLDTINAAKAAGATDEDLAPIYDLQRKATWRLDWVASENSMGFHADQEAARVLAESIDYSRQAQAAAVGLDGVVSAEEAE